MAVVCAISKRLIISEGLSFIPRMYGEEEVFAMKCGHAGMKVVYDESSAIVHNSHGVPGAGYEEWKHWKKEALFNIIGMKLFGFNRSIFK